MMGKSRLSAKATETLNFHCQGCKLRFSGPYARAKPREDRDWLPWDYFAICPECGEEAPQAAWEINLAKAHVNATGPTTPEGQAASAANLAGHPTPQEAQITRLNALKHGAYARVAMFFPARPGKYPQCEGCEHLESEYCLTFKACLKQGELFVRYAAAFHQNNPAMLREIVGSRQAALQVLIDQMILSIARAGGPEMISPEWYHDKDGGFHLARYRDEKTGEMVQLMKSEEHPLLKRLIEYIAKNNLSLADMGMTPKAQDEQEMLKGFLQQDQDGKEKESAFRTRLEHQGNALLQLLGKTTDPQRIPRDITNEGEIIGE